jgi:hypothetical protein
VSQTGFIEVALHLEAVPAVSWNRPVSSSAFLSGSSPDVPINPIGPYREFRYRISESAPCHSARGNCVRGEVRLGGPTWPPASYANDDRTTTPLWYTKIGCVKNTALQFEPEPPRFAAKALKFTRREQFRHILHHKGAWLTLLEGTNVLTP